MRYIHCACGTDVRIPGAEHHQLPAVPTRKDLRFLDAVARECLPVDPTPSLAEIQARPDVEHLGAPQPAPQEPDERLRVIVSGTDAALAAVLTRAMRADYLWAEIAYVPADPHSPASVCWGLAPFGAAEATTFAVEAPVAPAACVRNDTGDVIAGSASIYRGDGAGEFVGEVVVDSHTLIYNERAAARFFGQFGARLVPTMDAPGIACVPLTTPITAAGAASRRSPEQLEWLSAVPALRWLTRGKAAPAALPDPSRALTGRAVQAGGEGISVLIDARPKPRAVSHTTFYRHLRDIQSVRNASDPEV